jgi:hypothetical protein
MPYLWPASIYFALEQLAVKYPNLCTLSKFSFLTSQNVMGKYVRIAASPVVDGASVLITAGVHAREWAPPDAVLSLAQDLLAAYQNKTAITEKGYTLPAAAVQAIVNNLEIYIAPLVNPDGRNFSMVSPANNMWRKNRRQISAINPKTGKVFKDAQGRLPVGVDINRNFDIEWDFEQFFRPGTSISASKEPFDPDVYIGPVVASERETQNVVNVLLGKRITHFFDVHSSAHAVLYPWGIESNQSTDPTKSFTNQRMPPAGWFQARDGIGPGMLAYEEFIPGALLTQLQNLAQIMSAAVAQSTGAMYPAEPSGTGLYVTSGAVDDFAYSRDIQTMFAYTLELGGGGFQPDYVSEFPAVEHECHAALLAALDEIRKHPRPSQNGAAGPGGPGSAGTISAPSGGAPPGGGGGGGGIPPAGGGGGGAPRGAGHPRPGGGAAGVGTRGEDRRCCCKVKSVGHCSRFHVEDREGFREQVAFAASQAVRDRALVYETITNLGPQSVRVYWDGDPPNYETAGQSAVLLPGNSMTVAAGRTVKIVYEANSALPGNSAEGTDVISWCCPKS